MNTVNDYLGMAANILQIVTVVIAAVGAFGVWRYRRKLKDLLQGQQRTNQPGAVVMAIGIGDAIEPHVRQFANAHIMEGIHIEPYTRRGELSTDQFYAVLVELHRRKQKLIEIGATEVHLFYRGPVTLAMGIGSVFDNWVPVKVYGLNHHTGQYELHMTLGKGAVLGLLGDAGEMA